MAGKNTLIVIHQTPLQSWVRDASSAAMFIGLVGIGVVLDSIALQWAGAILGFLVIISQAISLRENHKMTVEQARKRLDEIEASFAELSRKDD